MGDAVPVTTGIGKPAEDLKSLIATSLGGIDNDRYYKFLFAETNPFKIEDPAIPNKVIDLKLDEVLKMRLDAALLDKEKGLYAKKFAASQDPTLKTLQVNYTKLVDAYKAAHNDKMPVGDDLKDLNKEFLEEAANKKLFEAMKIKLLSDNTAKMTTRVSTARAADEFIVGSLGVPPVRRFTTPVIIGKGDPGFNGLNNVAAFQTTALRSFYLDLTTDQAKKRLVMGHEPNERIVAGGFTHLASREAPSGQFIPYEKMFEMAMEYYTGGSEKHKLLGAKDSKRMGDSVMEGIQVQFQNQKSHLNKQGNAFLHDAGLVDNSFVNLQQPLRNFLDDIARFKTKTVAGKIKLDMTDINIKNPKVVKAIEDAFDLAQPEITDKKADYIVARRRALSRNQFLKELLHKHDKEPNDAAAKARDVTSATEIDTLVEKHTIGNLIWVNDPAAANARQNAATTRDGKRLTAISMFSEAYELDTLIENIKKMQEEIKTHYGPNFLSAVEQDRGTVVAANAPANAPVEPIDPMTGLTIPELEALRLATSAGAPPAPARSEATPSAAELEAMRLALKDFTPTPGGNDPKPTGRGKSGGMAA